MNRKKRNLTPKLRIVYHCFCAGIWEEIVNEHFGLVAGRSLLCTMIGSEKDQVILTDIAKRHQVDIEIFRYNDSQVFEHEALKLVELMSLKYPNDFTFYFHSKGASDNSRLNIHWRNYMNEILVNNFQEIFERFHKSKLDATGCLYVRMTNDSKMNGINSYFFAGNFWMASNRYLSELPNYEDLRTEFSNARHLAERYIGWNQPKVMYIDQKCDLTTSRRNNIYKRLINIMNE